MPRGFRNRKATTPRVLLVIHRLDKKLAAAEGGTRRQCTGNDTGAPATQPGRFDAFALNYGATDDTSY